MCKTKKHFFTSYWGDFTLCILVLIIFIFHMLDIPREIPAISVLIAMSALMLLFSLYQVFVRKKRQIKDIHYLLSSIGLLLMVIGFIPVHTNTLFLSLTTFAVWNAQVVATARPIIWLYKRYQAKKTAPADLPLEEEPQ